MIWIHDDIIITNDRTMIDTKRAHNFLVRAYWCRGIPYDTMITAFEHSIPFSVLHNEEFIGFCRLVTDSSTFAYLADVYIEENYRGRGYGHRLVEAVNDWIKQKKIRTSLLLTRDAQELYAAHNWVHFTDITRIMRFGEQQSDFYLSDVFLSKTG